MIKAALFYFFLAVYQRTHTFVLPDKAGFRIYPASGLFKIRLL